MQELIQLLNSEGYLVNEVIPDGKLYRFALDQNDKKESGYYIAHQNFSTRTGEQFFVILYGSWKTGDQKTYCSLKGPQSSEDRKNIKKKIEEAQKRETAHRKQVHEQTAIEVQKKWDSLSDRGESAYLDKKQINIENLDIRFEGGSFYIPMRDQNGKLWSMQKIQWDGSKFFFPGGKIKGCFHVLGKFEDSERILLTEGFATGASCFIATSLPIVIAFNSGNLPEVAAIIRAKYPDKVLVIAGDDDKNAKRSDGTPFNPGREKAEEAAQKCLGKAVFPKFKNPESKGTDFNDLAIEEGIEEVKKQLSDIPVEKLSLAALGFKEKEYFFTSSANRQIVPVSAFSETDFLNLMPFEYWEACFPGQGTSRVDWSMAKSSMMEQCRALGLFQPRHVRGAGVWNDAGRVIVNMGNHLIVDGKREELGSIKSRYFYTLGQNLENLNQNTLSNEECKDLVTVCKKFKWINPDHGFLLAGSLVVSRVCGALPVRPHVWITGSAQTGKTTLLERVIKPMLGNSTLYVQGNTSEAGIRQSLKADAIPVLFDEFETNGQKSQEMIASIVELMRASWSDSSAMIIKGGAQGNATSFQVRFCGIVSSIRVKLTNDADRSRFAILELAPHGNDPKHWDELSQMLDKIDREYSDKIFARTIKMMPILLDNFKLIKSALSKRISQRFGDQYGMLLAGCSILLYNDRITEKDAEWLADFVKLDDEKEESRLTDHEEAINHILGKKIKIIDHGDQHEISVAEAINSAKLDQFVNEALQRYGIKVWSDRIAIAVSHPEIELQFYRGTRWSQSWANSLSRLSGTEKNKSVWMAGKNTKCLIIPCGGLPVSI